MRCVNSPRDSEFFSNVFSAAHKIDANKRKSGSEVSMIIFHSTAAAAPYDDDSVQCLRIENSPVPSLSGRSSLFPSQLFFVYSPSFRFVYCCCLLFLYLGSFMTLAELRVGVKGTREKKTEEVEPETSDYVTEN